MASLRPLPWPPLPILPWPALLNPCPLIHPPPLIHTSSHSQALVGLLRAVVGARERLEEDCATRGQSLESMAKGGALAKVIASDDCF